jgi:hypothetical protein
MYMAITKRETVRICFTLAAALSYSLPLYICESAHHTSHPSPETQLKVPHPIRHLKYPERKAIYLALHSPSVQSSKAVYFSKYPTGYHKRFTFASTGTLITR